MREMVRPTSAADINSRPVAASPAAPMRNLDLLLRLSGRIVKGCRLPGSLALLSRGPTRDARVDPDVSRSDVRDGPAGMEKLPANWGPVTWLRLICAAPLSRRASACSRR